MFTNESSFIHLFYLFILFIYLFIYLLIFLSVYTFSFSFIFNLFINLFICRDAKPSDKKNRGVYVKEDVLNFESTNKGESCELEFRLCNVSKELQKV